MPGPVFVPGRYAHTSNVVSAGGTLYAEPALTLLLQRELWQPPSRLQTIPPAGPFVRGHGAQTIVTTAGTNYVLNTPPGTAAGDLLLASITLNNHASFVAGQEFGVGDSGVPAGWTKIFNESTQTTTTFSLHVFQRVADGTETGTYTWTAAQAVTGSGSPLAIGNADTGAFDSTISDFQPSTVTGATVGGNLTTAGLYDLLVSFCGIDSGTTFTVTGPGGFAEEWGWTLNPSGQRNAAGTSLSVPAGTTSVLWTLNTTTLSRAMWAAAVKAPTAPVTAVAPPFVSQYSGRW